MSRRRQPPLFEFLGAPRRSTVVAEGNVMGRRPVEVPVPRADRASTASTPAEPFERDSAPDRPHRAFRSPVALLAFAAAGGLALVAVIWSLAFSMGQQEKEKQLAPHLSDTASSQITAPSVELPLPPMSTGSPGLAANDPSLGASSPGLTLLGKADDTRQMGLNYLELAVLTYKDGQAAVQYLAKNGVHAALAPARNVDPDKARANNLPHLVFVSDGIPSDRFKTTEKDRKALEAKVEQIGKRWQRDERGASDFSRPVWRLFKGKE